jgi:hypothetical protein
LAAAAAKYPTGSAVPSAENIGYYLPELQDYVRRRQVLDAATKLTPLTPVKAGTGSGRRACLLYSLFMACSWPDIQGI